MPVIASELNVDAALESTVMCLGDSICLQVKLISTFPEERQLWVGNFKVEKSKITNLYNRIVSQIASEVQIKLTPSEKTQLAGDRKRNPALLEAIYKGRFHMNQLTPEGFELGIKFFEEAIAIDPSDPLPYLGLAHGYSLAGQSEKALELIAGLEELGWTWYTWGIADVFSALGEYDSAIYWIEEAIDRRHDFAPWFKVYAPYEPMFQDPRFQENVNRIHYPE